MRIGVCVSCAVAVSDQGGRLVKGCVSLFLLFKKFDLVPGSRSGSGETLAGKRWIGKVVKLGMGEADNRTTCK